MTCSMFRVSLIFLLLLSLSSLPFSSSLLASGRVVTSDELHGILLEKARSREENLAVLEGFLSHPAAAESILRLERVRTAVSSLDDAELERLARYAEQVEDRFAAGQLTNLQLTYIVIALAAAVLVLIIVA